MRLSAFFAGLVLLIGLTGTALAQDNTDPNAAPVGTPAAPTSSAAPGDFYKDGLQMGTTLCGNAGTYSCDSISSSSDTLIEAANQCVMTYHGISERIMTDFRNSGEYENCVLPSRIFTDSTGSSSWSVCCVRRLRPGEECSLVCTRFIANKSR